ncbi:hypothetical protein R3P38DRAFT_2455505, partial [Favolaschia claudopus]
MSCPDFRKEVERFDINLFQETHMYPDQEDTVELPHGFSIFSRARNTSDLFNEAWGGVAVVYRASLNVEYRKDLSGPDFMVLQLNELLVYNTYLLPESSQWAGALEKDPCGALAASLSLAYMTQRNILVLGDLNARIIGLLAASRDPPRVTMDDGNVTTRGRWLCQIFNDYDIVFVSGATCFGPASAKHTSFQGSRKTVIDYAACSRGLFSQVKSFRVADRERGYDHAALELSLEIDVGELKRVLNRPRKKRRTETVLPDTTELDRLFIQTLAAADDEERKIRTLYGPVLCVSTPIKVTIHGSCMYPGKISASGGAAAFWGPSARHNSSARVWGIQTSARAELMAALIAIRDAPQTKSLEISTRSQYVIRSIAHEAPVNSVCGWRCLNGDILKRIFDFIRLRAAPIHFNHISTDNSNTNGHLGKAIEMARAACSFPRNYNPVDAPLVSQSVSLTTQPLSNVQKVTADLAANNAGGAEKQTNSVKIPQRPTFPLPHRGRDR